MSKRLFLAPLVLSLALAQQPTIRTTVPLVTLPVTVMSKDREPVAGLIASDFILLDEGKPRPVRVDVVDFGLAPVALVVLIQTTDMSLAALAKIKKVGAIIPLEVVGANGSAAVLTYDEDVKVLQDFTKIPDAVSEAFLALKPHDSGAGRMLDAVDEALEMLQKQPAGQRANILIIGESRDRGSKQKLDQIIPKLQRTGATVYCLSYSKLITPYTMKADEFEPVGGGLLDGPIELARLAKRNTFKALTEVSGGEQYRFEIKAALEERLARIGKDIHNRYNVSFTPEAEQTSRFHPITLIIKDRPDLVVRTRPGYWTDVSAAAN